MYVEDFNSERVDRERIHSQLEDLKEEFAQTKERMLIERQQIVQVQAHQCVHYAYCFNFIEK